jgi:hypothetical protein
LYLGFLQKTCTWSPSLKTQKITAENGATRLQLGLSQGERQQKLVDDYRQATQSDESHGCFTSTEHDELCTFRDHDQSCATLSTSTIIAIKLIKNQLFKTIYNHIKFKMWYDWRWKVGSSC